MIQLQEHMYFKDNNHKPQKLLQNPHLYLKRKQYNHLNQLKRQMILS